MRRPLRKAAHLTRAWVRTAPGTYLWLAALFVTTVALHRVSPPLQEDFLRRRSTNLHQLSQNPVRVLVTGAFWIDGGRWLPYAALHTVVHAPAEHWLGTRRWLATAATAHVGATLVGEGVLSWAIHQGRAHEAAGDTLDVGVGYALAGVAAVLTYRIAPPWRYPYGGAVVILHGVPLLARPDFTDIGHFSAVLIGLACYPLAQGHPATPYLDTSAKRGVRTPS
ncbi:rhomboid-like protein [Streptomyces sp. NPDC006645]|uniref:rhomboid-like protein n=1 Tax=unclassified Streptomyces TaxID=2593676 RepID=UPI0033A2072E